MSVVLVNQQSGSLKYRRGALTTVISFLLLCLTMSRSHLSSQAPPRFRAAVRISTVSILKLSSSVVQSVTFSVLHCHGTTAIETLTAVQSTSFFWFSFWGLPFLNCSELLSKAPQLLKLSLAVVHIETVTNCSKHHSPLLKLSLTVVQSTTVTEIVTNCCPKHHISLLRLSLTVAQSTAAPY